MLTTATAPVTRNLIVDYYDVISSAVARLGAGPGDPAGTRASRPASTCRSCPATCGSSSPWPPPPGASWARTAVTSCGSWT
ncbi:hypothetical protein ACFQY4_30115 [Catellatospora bangladeshensis]|uniref:hypothetical protein n=1 Tax=Catellatospora bangladeshensis TaxID=310355 RepID=UPI003616E162